VRGNFQGYKLAQLANGTGMNALENDSYIA
jgi:hypothetical protein